MFNRTFNLLLILSLFTGVLGAAADSFVGDWKFNPSRSRRPDYPQRLLILSIKIESLGANKYTILTLPEDLAGDVDGSSARAAVRAGLSETIVADGTDQPAEFGNTLSVTVGGPDTWKFVRKSLGRVYNTVNWTLSKDGNTLTNDFTDIAPNGSTTSGNYVYKRTAGGPGFAGTWVSINDTRNIAFGLQVRPYEGDGLSFRTLGETKNVKFDGKDYPNADGRNASASLRRVDERTLEMTEKINGEVVDTQEIKVSPDLKTLTITVHYTQLARSKGTATPPKTAGQSEPSILVFERK